MSTLSPSSTRVSRRAQMRFGSAVLALARLGLVARAAAPATAQPALTLARPQTSAVSLAFALVVLRIAPPAVAGGAP